MNPPPPRTLNQIDDAVDAWHDGAGQGQELHEYLGMTWDEYSLWAQDPNQWLAQHAPREGTA